VRLRLLLALPFAGAALVATLRPRRVEVIGESMLPALRPGDRLLLLRLPVRPGDVVAVIDPREPRRTLVKRLAGLDAPGGGYVVLGDNPRASTDSGDFGPVAPRLLRGRAVYRYAPPEHRGRL
jgi:nickel-type superoxide dismutase maturation protease